MEKFGKKKPIVKWAITRVFDAFPVGRRVPNITRNEKQCLIAIARFADNETLEAWPTRAMIADEMIISSSKVSPIFKSLAKKGLLTVKRKYDGDRKMTRNYYVINLEVLVSMSAVDQKDVKIEAQVCSKPKLIAQEEVDKQFKEAVISSSIAQLNEHNEHDQCSDLAHDQCRDLEHGTPYILTTHTPTTKHTSKSKDIVQIGQKPSNVEQLPVSYFDEFWAAYPKKENRLRAMNIWYKNNLDKIGQLIIRDVLNRRECHLQWKNKEFIPLASSYLNGERWNDEIYAGEIKTVSAMNTDQKESRKAEQMRKIFDKYEEDRKARESK